MSNSKLTTYTNLTKNKSKGRTHAIDTVTIHCFVGQVTAKEGCDYFARTEKQASSNYVVGRDGSIGLSVEECNRAWTSGGKKTAGGMTGSQNDQRAITIEVASETTHPYAITDAAMEALVKLLVDICQRNPGIGRLRWKGDVNLVGQVEKQNMTVHRWFAAKACPGDYLYNRHGEIAAEVNRRLDAAESKEKPKEKPQEKPQERTYTVKKGDTLHRIATVNKTTVAALVATNDIKNPNLIYVDQVIMLETSPEAATEKLKVLGVINSPDYWVKQAAAVKWLPELLEKAATAISHPGARKETPEDGVAALAAKGVINTPAYWLGIYNDVPYLGDLLAVLGGAVK